MIKAVIIDDEAPARSNLNQILKDNFDDVVVLDEADSVASGVELLNRVGTDVVFLDIDLSDGTGFNVLENVDDINFQIIFITAYNNYAIKAFRFNALDYILKPIELELLEEAIKKLRSKVGNGFITKNELKIMLDNYNKKDEEKQLAISEANKIAFVPLVEIVMCKADSNYTLLYLKDGSQKVTSKTLKRYEELLPSAMFYRVNMSYIINLKEVKEYSKEGYVQLKDGTSLEVSRRRKADFMEVLKTFSIELSNN